jgi:hypothetical protein
MSYKTQALLAKDDQLLARVTACAATEGIPEPGWDAAYAYAITAAIPNPGNDEGCITDGMILASVQAIATAEAASSP